MTAPADVLMLAMQLPETDRAAIAHQLLLSLEPESFDDAEISSAWQEEIEGRLQKIADGKHRSHDWRQSLQEIRAELKQESRP